MTEQPTYLVAISGPAVTINNVLAVVQDALERAGFPVAVGNDYPSLISRAEELAFVATLKNKGQVVIEMNHHPWGG